MAEARPLCRHKWIDRTTLQDAHTVLFCPRCASYRFEARPQVPDGDLYYLQEVTPRDEEDNDGAS